MMIFKDKLLPRAYIDEEGDYGVTKGPDSLNTNWTTNIIFVVHHRHHHHHRIVLSVNKEYSTVFILRRGV